MVVRHLAWSDLGWVFSNLGLGFGRVGRGSGEGQAIRVWGVGFHGSGFRVLRFRI